MAFFFAKRWSFTLSLDALTDVHVGSGRLVFVESDGNSRQVLEQAKDVNGKAYIPSTAFKGASRDTGRGAGHDIDTLFGKACVNAPSSRAGRLVFFGATLKEHGAALDMPKFNPQSGTYIRPQHARDRDTRTVKPKYLYHAENIPRGTHFTLEAMFFDHDGAADGLKELVMPLLDRMAADDGFSVGANKTTLGQMRLADTEVSFACDKITRKEKNDHGRTCITVGAKKTVRVIPIKPTSPAQRMLNINCPGPLLIADPERGEAAAALTPDRKKVISEMRFAKGQPSGWERALRQSLRSLAGYLEATLDENSSDRIDDPFLSYKSFNLLCSTQRLFGVEGFRGLLSLHVYEAENQDHGSFPGLELDVLTQGALEPAAFLINCPVGGRLKIALRIDKARYDCLLSRLDDAEAIRKGDAALVDRLNEYVATQGIQAGAKVTRGYGWFAPFDMALSLGEP
ncbi:RAMP superfamily CRISPR-associated protein [Sedimentitalea todarodis]|uniref:RAMP superfamily CRISPR-associated protein n=1 Tax=Sedimentitalea todarodis TaxID=1631240 RepID=A0ABU3VE85_9RHOB|nr:RAMP superfamily CRISPR-associated protein [Sedimentitalea todarodis]MDU9004479.1 RAMP superfamily CRISPR-associated protein [Sedimentitalea todarodis]